MRNFELLEFVRHQASRVWSVVTAWIMAGLARRRNSKQTYEDLNDALGFMDNETERSSASTVRAAAGTPSKPPPMTIVLLVNSAKNVSALLMLAVLICEVFAYYRLLEPTATSSLSSSSGRL
jgi:hypothetical protein